MFSNRSRVRNDRDPIVLWSQHINHSTYRMNLQLLVRYMKCIAGKTFHYKIFRNVVSRCNIQNGPYCCLMCIVWYANDMLGECVMWYWVSCYDMDEWSVCLISVANRTSGLLWPECGECCSAAAVLVSREIRPSYDEPVWWIEHACMWCTWFTLWLCTSVA